MIPAAVPYPSPSISAIKMGTGMLLNLFMPGKGREIRAMQHTLEEDFRIVLLQLSESIGKGQQPERRGKLFCKMPADLVCFQPSCPLYIEICACFLRKY